jgi:phosphoglycerol transferase MdoB-like AlkP superfamily enzyme
MELDKAMAYLIDHLKEAGKLDNTLIVLFADHHPLETAIKTLDDYGGYAADRLDGLNEDRTPMIFYSGSIKGEKLDEVNSTFDILPTVANLTGLEYDPRLYVGTDYFSDTPKTVIFPNGTWIMGENTYYSSDDTFEGTLSPEEVEHKNNEVTNLFSISRLIYKYDYFGKRDTIAFPKYR